jgi:2-dehydro-3-deoxyglucarate aldolase/4-hydroxy-2-oxoheptanedioate aldolase
MTDLPDRIRSGDPVVGSWVSLADPAVAEIAALLEFDFALVDMEHTAMSLETVTGMARAVDAAGTHTGSIVRVPWNDPVMIKRVLDAGVGGVMVPMVESPEAARSFVEAVRYPPEGIRGVAAGRAADYGLAFEEYVETASDRLVTIAQVETQPALDDVAAISAVEGLDALFVGPADLSTAVGAFLDYESDAFRDAVAAVIEASEVPVGTVVGQPDRVEAFAELGFDFLIAGHDTAGILAGGFQAKLAAESALTSEE